jgi:WD40 repeat protein
VRLWDTATGGLQQIIVSHTDLVLSVAFSPDGRLLASGSSDQTLRLWDMDAGGLQQTPKSHLGSVQSVAFLPDGRLLASGSSDHTVRLWDATTGSLRKTFEDHPNQVWVWSVAFSPNGRLLASGSSDNTVRLWDTTTGALQETLSTKGIVTELGFSQDGSHLSTDLGSFRILSICGDRISSSRKTGPEIVLKRRDWIALNGKQVLWLPPEARPSCSAIKANKVALGHASGYISFIGFRV